MRITFFVFRNDSNIIAMVLEGCWVSFLGIFGKMALLETMLSGNYDSTNSESTTHELYSPTSAPTRCVTRNFFLWSEFTITDTVGFFLIFWDGTAFFCTLTRQLARATELRRLETPSASRQGEGKTYHAGTQYVLCTRRTTKRFDHLFQHTLQSEVL